MNARLDTPVLVEADLDPAELLHRARTQIGSCTYWAEQGDCQPQLLASLRTLAAQVEAARRALTLNTLVKRGVLYYGGGEDV